MLRRVLAIVAFGLVALAGSVTADPTFWAHEWPETDFSKTEVDSWVEIISGGPSKDGIPAITDPDMLAVDEVHVLSDREALMTVALDGHPARAYPIRYLIWHEIVNDRIGEVPVAVTFCPLCNSGMVFDRRSDGQVLEFGVSGKLRHSDMIMYDRQTESWWQQAVGRAIVGELTGTTLTSLPAWMESWEDFRTAHPDGLVMAEPAHARPYGRNPYTGYDSSARPFLYSGEMPPHDVPALARVVRVENRAWPLTRLAEAGRIDEAGVVLSWEAGLASALDSDRLSAGRDVGAVRVRDAAGRDLPHDVMFAFAFHAFWPEGTWMLGD